MKKPELLSPAGNYEALQGAINAGADAVYLGGELYGARAYADNFTQDEILSGLHMAHLFGRKIYLTVNTLVKEKELDGLYDFLLPFYEAGLDGVIVQDLGVLRYIRNRFPALPIPASALHRKRESPPPAGNYKAGNLPHKTKYNPTFCPHPL